MLYHQVDPYYPNHPNCRITLKDCTRLKCSSQETSNWIDDLSKHSAYYTV